MKQILMAGFDSSVIGGGAKSEEYRQTFADLSGKPRSGEVAAAAPGAPATATLSFGKTGVLNFTSSHWRKLDLCESFQRVI